MPSSWPIYGGTPRPRPRPVDIEQIGADMGIAGNQSNVLQGAGGGETPPPEPETFDPGDHTIDDVKAYVEAHPGERAAVLAAEEAGKARVTLIEWLTAEA